MSYHKFAAPAGGCIGSKGHRWLDLLFVWLRFWLLSTRNKISSRFIPSRYKVSGTDTFIKPALYRIARTFARESRDDHQPFLSPGKSNIHQVQIINQVSGLLLTVSLLEIGFVKGAGILYREVARAGKQFLVRLYPEVGFLVRIVHPPVAKGN